MSKGIVCELQSVDIDDRKGQWEVTLRIKALQFLLEIPSVYSPVSWS